MGLYRSKSKITVKPKVNSPSGFICTTKPISDELREKLRAEWDRLCCGIPASTSFIIKPKALSESERLKQIELDNQALIEGR